VQPGHITVHCTAIVGTTAVLLQMQYSAVHCVGVEWSEVQCSANAVQCSTENPLSVCAYVRAPCTLQCSDQCGYHNRSLQTVQCTAVRYRTITGDGGEEGPGGRRGGEAGQHQKNPKKCKVMDTLLPFFIRGSGCQYNGR
jgi:hypothetical protein